MKVIMTKATTKWGKEMEEIIPERQYIAYGKILGEALTGEEVTEVVMERK
jgi:hypothetical protein